MSETSYALLGVAAGVVNTVGMLPYIIDIFRGKTQPERAMWWIYVALFGVLFAAQASAGATWLLVVTAAYILSAGLIAVLSLKYGYGSFHKRDTVSLVAAAFGIALWLAVDQPLIAILVVILVDLAGFWLTLVKTWHAPHTETLVAWQLSCVAAVLSVFAAGSWEPAIILYPVYAVAGTGFLVWLIMYRRGKVSRDAADF